MDGWIERLHADNYMQKMSFISYLLAPCIICFVSKQRQWVMSRNSAAPCQLFTSNSPSPSLLLRFQTALGDWLCQFKEKQLTIPWSACPVLLWPLPVLELPGSSRKWPEAKLFWRWDLFPIGIFCLWIVPSHLLGCQGCPFPWDFVCRCQKLQHFTEMCLLLRSPCSITARCILLFGTIWSNS